MADPLSRSLPQPLPASRDVTGICETEAAVLDACSGEVLRHGLYAAIYGGEVIVYGARRSDTVLAALRSLNADNPAGEPRWTRAEVARLVIRLRRGAGEGRHP